jgi:hypothetical protein
VKIAPVETALGWGSHQNRVLPPRLHVLPARGEPPDSRLGKRDVGDLPHGRILRRGDERERAPAPAGFVTGANLDLGWEVAGREAPDVESSHLKGRAAAGGDVGGPGEIEAMRRRALDRERGASPGHQGSFLPVHRAQVDEEGRDILREELDSRQTFAGGSRRPIGDDDPLACVEGLLENETQDLRQVPNHSDRLVPAERIPRMLHRRSAHIPLDDDPALGVRVLELERTPAQPAVRCTEGRMKIESVPRGETRAERLDAKNQCRFAAGDQRSVAPDRGEARRRCWSRPRRPLYGGHQQEEQKNHNPRPDSGRDLSHARHCSRRSSAFASHDDPLSAVYGAGFPPSRAPSAWYPGRHAARPAATGVGDRERASIGSQDVPHRAPAIPPPRFRPPGSVHPGA